MPKHRKDRKRSFEDVAKHNGRDPVFSDRHDDAAIRKQCLAGTQLYAEALMREGYLLDNSPRAVERGCAPTSQILTSNA
jgi:hypothetical protein